MTLPLFEVFDNPEQLTCRICHLGLTLYYIKSNGYGGQYGYSIYSSVRAIKIPRFWV